MAKRLKGKAVKNEKHSVIHTPTKRIRSVIVKLKELKLKDYTAFAFTDFSEECSVQC